MPTLCLEHCDRAQAIVCESSRAAVREATTAEDALCLQHAVSLQLCYIGHFRSPGCASVLVNQAATHKEIYQLSKQKNVHIISSDIPDLYKHDVNPAEALMQKVIFAARIQFEYCASRCTDVSVSSFTNFGSGFRFRFSRVQAAR